ncbi:putative quinol monooxygenase [Noviherbaspirillum sp. Root189]|uniref:putative quinol monooxygenase n=1 Tax=Noviherbaspirillum sp. Root189 TaxID=1736487 RepID=UPI00070EA9A0|nr:antibiotic biosynthesis monooxygenase [Noviherbaspirillum sp. Root189]KRB93735.1 hypothetical protein ASE07_11695 [Noviherbaspirillum sp. Root189]
MRLIAIMGRFEFAPHDIDAAITAAAAMASQTRRESGCLSYTFGVDIEQPECLILSELWLDGAALEAHFETAHMAAFRLQLRKLRVVEVKASRFAISDMRDMFPGNASAAANAT